MSSETTLNLPLNFDRWISTIKVGSYIQGAFVEYDSDIAFDNEFSLEAYCKSRNKQFYDLFFYNIYNHLNYSL